jgi:hypothetical protein
MTFMSALTLIWIQHDLFSNQEQLHKLVLGPINSEKVNLYEIAKGFEEKIPKNIFFKVSDILTIITRQITQI